MLDEICSLCGYERKYAMKVLAGSRPIVGEEGKQRGGSKPRYGKMEKKVPQVIWLAAEQPCGKRMKPTMRLWSRITSGGIERINRTLLWRP